MGAEPGTLYTNPLGHGMLIPQHKGKAWVLQGCVWAQEHTSVHTGTRTVPLRGMCGRKGLTQPGSLPGRGHFPHGEGTALLLTGQLHAQDPLRAAAVPAGPHGQEKELGEAW